MKTNQEFEPTPLAVVLKTTRNLLSGNPWKPGKRGGDCGVTDVLLHPLRLALLAGDVVVHREVLSHLVHAATRLSHSLADHDDLIGVGEGAGDNHAGGVAVLEMQAICQRDSDPYKSSCGEGCLCFLRRQSGWWRSR